MKRLLLAFAIFSTTYAFEFTDYTQVILNCKALTQGHSTAKNIDLMFLEKNHNNKKSIEFVSINHHQSFSDNGAYNDPILSTYFGIRSKQDNNENWSFSYEIEYFTNTLTVLEDDNGFKLMTDFISDGPVEIGFYECEGKREQFEDYAFVSAWQRLEDATDSNVATTYQAKVLSEAYCGEVDPYMLGDACGYEVEILSDSAKGEKITVYFYDYDFDSFKAGDVIKFDAITIEDYEKKAFAGQLL